MATPLIGFVISATAGAVTALALVVVTFVGSLVLAPVAQRNSLREQITGRDDDLRFTGSLEHVRWEFDLPFKPGGRIFTIHTQAVAWVWVKNNGPTATVAAAINNVTGVPTDWDDYFVAEAAWDQKHSATVVIPHQGRRRLKVASVVRAPQRGLWFWTTEGGKEVPGWQWWMGNAETADVRFEVVLTNTSTDRVAACRGRIKVPRDVVDSSFELVGNS